MSTWVGAPSPARIAATGSGKGAGIGNGQGQPSPQNYPFTGQPTWVAAPKSSSLINSTTGQTV